MSGSPLPAPFSLFLNGSFAGDPRGLPEAPTRGKPSPDNRFVAFLAAGEGRGRGALRVLCSRGGLLGGLEVEDPVDFDWVVSSHGGEPSGLPDASQARADQFLVVLTRANCALFFFFGPSSPDARSARVSRTPLRLRPAALPAAPPSRESLVLLESLEALGKGNNGGGEPVPVGVFAVDLAVLSTAVGLPVVEVCAVRSVPKQKHGSVLFLLNGCSRFLHAHVRLSAADESSSSFPSSLFAELTAVDQAQTWFSAGPSAGLHILDFVVAFPWLMALLSDGDVYLQALHAPLYHRIPVASLLRGSDLALSLSPSSGGGCSPQWVRIGISDDMQWLMLVAASKVILFLDLDLYDSIHPLYDPRVLYMTNEELQQHNRSNPSLRLHTAIQAASPDLRASLSPIHAAGVSRDSLWMNPSFTTRLAHLRHSLITSSSSSSSPDSSQSGAFTSQFTSSHERRRVRWFERLHPDSLVGHFEQLSFYLPQHRYQFSDGAAELPFDALNGFSSDTLIMKKALEESSQIDEGDLPVNRSSSASFLRMVQVPFFSSLSAPPSRAWSTLDNPIISLTSSPRILSLSVFADGVYVLDKLSAAWSRWPQPKQSFVSLSSTHSSRIYFLQDNMLGVILPVMSKETLLRDLVLSEDLQSAGRLCALNGWSLVELHMLAIQLGLRNRQLPVLEAALLSVDGSSQLRAVGLLEEFMQRSSEAVAQPSVSEREVATHYAMVELGIQFVARVVGSMASRDHVDDAALEPLAATLELFREHLISRSPISKQDGAHQPPSRHRTPDPAEERFVQLFGLRPADEVSYSPNLAHDLLTAVQKSLDPRLFGSWSKMDYQDLVRDALLRDHLSSALSFIRLTEVQHLLGPTTSQSWDHRSALLRLQRGMNPTATTSSAAISSGASTNAAAATTTLRDVRSYGFQLVYQTLTQSELAPARQMISSLNAPLDETLSFILTHTSRRSLRRLLASSSLPAQHQALYRYAQQVEALYGRSSFSLEPDISKFRRALGQQYSPTKPAGMARRKRSGTLRNQVPHSGCASMALGLLSFGEVDDMSVGTAERYGFSLPVSPLQALPSTAANPIQGLQESFDPHRRMILLYPEADVFLEPDGSREQLRSAYAHFSLHTIDIHWSLHAKRAILFEHLCQAQPGSNASMMAAAAQACAAADVDGSFRLLTQAQQADEAFRFLCLFTVCHHKWTSLEVLLKTHPSLPSGRPESPLVFTEQACDNPLLLDLFSLWKRSPIAKQVISTSLFSRNVLLVSEHGQPVLDQELESSGGLVHFQKLQHLARLEACLQHPSKDQRWTDWFLKFCTSTCNTGLLTAYVRKLQPSFTAPSSRERQLLDLLKAFSSPPSLWELAFLNATLVDDNSTVFEDLDHMCSRSSLDPLIPLTALLYSPSPLIPEESSANDPRARISTANLERLLERFPSIKQATQPLHQYSCKESLGFAVVGIDRARGLFLETKSCLLQQPFAMHFDQPQLAGHSPLSQVELDFRHFLINNLPFQAFQQVPDSLLGQLLSQSSSSPEVAQAKAKVQALAWHFFQSATILNASSTFLKLCQLTAVADSLAVDVSAARMVHGLLQGCSLPTLFASLFDEWTEGGSRLRTELEPLFDDVPRLVCHIFRSPDRAIQSAGSLLLIHAVQTLLPGCDEVVDVLDSRCSTPRLEAWRAVNQYAKEHQQPFVASHLIELAQRNAWQVFLVAADHLGASPACLFQTISAHFGDAALREHLLLVIPSQIPKENANQQPQQQQPCQSNSVNSDLTLALAVEPNPDAFLRSGLDSLKPLLVVLAATFPADAQRQASSLLLAWLMSQPQLPEELSQLVHDARGWEQFTDGNHLELLHTVMSHLLLKHRRLVLLESGALIFFAVDHPLCLFVRFFRSCVDRLFSQAEELFARFLAALDAAVDPPAGWLVQIGSSVVDAILWECTPYEERQLLCIVSNDAGHSFAQRFRHLKLTSDLLQRSNAQDSVTVRSPPASILQALLGMGCYKAAREYAATIIPEQLFQVSLHEVESLFVSFSRRSKRNAYLTSQLQNSFADLVEKCSQVFEHVSASASEISRFFEDKAEQAGDLLQELSLLRKALEWSERAAGDRTHQLLRNRILLLSIRVDSGQDSSKPASGSNSSSSSSTSSSDTPSDTASLEDIIGKVLETQSYESALQVAAQIQFQSTDLMLVDMSLRVAKSDPSFSAATLLSDPDASPALAEVIRSKTPNPDGLALYQPLELLAVFRDCCVSSSAENFIERLIVYSRISERFEATYEQLSSRDPLSLFRQLLDLPEGSEGLSSYQLCADLVRVARLDILAVSRTCAEYILRLLLSGGVKGAPAPTAGASMSTLTRTASSSPEASHSLQRSLSSSMVSSSSRTPGAAESGEMSWSALPITQICQIFPNPESLGSEVLALLDGLSADALPHPISVELLFYAHGAFAMVSSVRTEDVIQRVDAWWGQLAKKGEYRVLVRLLTCLRNPRHYRILFDLLVKLNKFDLLFVLPRALQHEEERIDLRLALHTFLKRFHPEDVVKHLQLLSAFEMWRSLGDAHSSLASSKIASIPAAAFASPAGRKPAASPHLLAQLRDAENSYLQAADNYEKAGCFDLHSRVTTHLELIHLQRKLPTLKVVGLQAEEAKAIVCRVLDYQYAMVILQAYGCCDFADWCDILHKRAIELGDLKFTEQFINARPFQADFCVEELTKRVCAPHSRRPEPVGKTKLVLDRHAAALISILQPLSNKSLVQQLSSRLVARYPEARPLLAGLLPEPAPAPSKHLPTSSFRSEPRSSSDSGSSSSSGRTGSSNSTLSPGKQREAGNPYHLVSPQHFIAPLEWFELNDSEA